MQLKSGDHIGDYEVLGVLGAGGMGSVYKVRNVISDRVEAIKLLLPNLVEHPDLKERFLREIKTSASLEHPSIAGLRTAFQNGDMLLMVMEFVEGDTLDARLRQGSLPIGEAARVTAQVLNALEYAHSRGVVHRDIKPANIMISRSGGVKLLDFGIAKATTDKQITVAGTTMGSLYYMSPEQIRGEQVDQRADLYSLGITLYELTTGKRPFGGDSGYAIMAEHLQKQPAPPVEIDSRVPSAMSAVILRSLAKNPADRYQSASEFREDLLRSLSPAEATVVMGNATTDPRFTAPAQNAPGQPSEGIRPTSVPPPSPPPQGGSAFAGAVHAGTTETPRPANVAPQPASPAIPASPVPQTAQAEQKKPSNTLALAMVAIIAFLVLAAVGLVFAGSWFMASSTTTAGTQPTWWERFTGASESGGETSPTAEDEKQELATNEALPENIGGAGPEPVPNEAQGTSSPTDLPRTAPGRSNTAAALQGGSQQNTKNGQEMALARPARQQDPYVTSGGGTTTSPASVAPPATTPPSPPATPQPTRETPTVDPQALDTARDFFSKLGIRAGTIQESARKLIEEQSSMGVTLRADMRASLKRMELLMDQAEASLDRGNLHQASQQMEGAEREIEKLEKFFRI